LAKSKALKFERIREMTQPNELTCNRFDSMTPAERLRVSFEASVQIRQILADLIRIEIGDTTNARLKWEVALRLYGSDPEARGLLMQFEPDDDLKWRPPRRSIGLHTLGIAPPELIE
jgi:hypothetical protein